MGVVIRGMEAVILGTAAVILDRGRVGGGRRRDIRMLMMVSSLKSYRICSVSALRGLVGLSKSAKDICCLFFFLDFLED